MRACGGSDENEEASRRGSASAGIKEPRLDKAESEHGVGQSETFLAQSEKEREKDTVRKHCATLPKAECFAKPSQRERLRT